MEIVSSILTTDFNEAKEILHKCEGVLKRVSIDIIDGKFVDNKTVTPDLFSDIDTSFNLDYHLMVLEPVNWIERCIRGQADRIIGHIERMTSQSEFVGKVQEVGVKVGLAIDLETPVESLDSDILNNLDVVLVMSVKAGFGGQKFHEDVLEKIKKLDLIRRKDETPFKIHVDGGVNFDNIKRIVSAGADEVSIGRTLFKDDFIENIERLEKIIGDN